MHKVHSVTESFTPRTLDGRKSIPRALTAMESLVPVDRKWLLANDTSLAALDCARIPICWVLLHTSFEGKRCIRPGRKQSCLLSTKHLRRYTVCDVTLSVLASEISVP
jgi:hypothetical protein